jgi:MerR family transcriptional regulator, copper efflux regulator
MSLSITDVARRTGFSTSTLRYYDRLGVLASAARAANGYRQYDDRAVARLRFIARAKALGCTLDEIASLLTAFDEKCGEVQAPLRDLVDGKIAIARRRVAELVALTAQLQEARQALTTEAADGPCGPGCACVDETTHRPDRATRAGRWPTLVVQMTDSRAAIACTLDDEDMGQRMVDWQAVLEHAVERSPLEGGIRVTFGPRVAIDDVARLARDEQACCSFFDFALTVDQRGIALEVRAPEAAQTLIESIFGSAGHPARTEAQDGRRI